MKLDNITIYEILFLITKKEMKINTQMVNLMNSQVKAILDHNDELKEAFEIDIQQCKESNRVLNELYKEIKSLIVDNGESNV